MIIDTYRSIIYKSIFACSAFPNCPTTQLPWLSLIDNCWVASGRGPEACRWSFTEPHNLLQTLRETFVLKTNVTTTLYDFCPIFDFDGDNVVEIKHVVFCYMCSFWLFFYLSTMDENNCTNRHVCVCRSSTNKNCDVWIIRLYYGSCCSVMSRNWLENVVDIW